MKMEFPSSVARMAWKMETPFWRPVSMTERTAAKSWPSHWERKPLVTFRNTTLGRSARSEGSLTRGLAVKLSVTYLPGSLFSPR